MTTRTLPRYPNVVASIANRHRCLERAPDQLDQQERICAGHLLGRAGVTRQRGRAGQRGKQIAEPAIRATVGVGVAAPGAAGQPGQLLAFAQALRHTLNEVGDFGVRQAGATRLAAHDQP